jgi:hypothetical protein
VGRDPAARAGGQLPGVHPQGRLLVRVEEFLFNQAPQLDVIETRTASTRSRSTSTWAPANLVNELQVTASASRWTVLPGMVAMVGRRVRRTAAGWCTGGATAARAAGDGDVEQEHPDQARARAGDRDDELHARPGSRGVAGYVNPFRRIRGLSANRIDMGVDYAGSGPVLAIGDAKVYAAASSGTGWPGGGFIGYTLLDGPYKGKHVFIAENVRPSVHVGRVSKPARSSATCPAGSRRAGGRASPTVRSRPSSASRRPAIRARG